MSLFSNYFKGTGNNNSSSNDNSQQTVAENSMSDYNVSDNEPSGSGFVNDSDPGLTVKTSTFGTGHPIDAIYDFITRNFEDEGYMDAMVNSDISYRVSKEELLRNNLKSRFQQVRLRYNDDIRILKVRINTAESQMVVTAAEMLKAQVEIFENHLKQLDQMEQDLQKNDPRMTQMIESYKRGFLKGIAAQSIGINN